MVKRNFWTNNKTWLIPVIIVLAIILLFGGYIVGKYNGFVKLEQDINGKWSEVENQYQRQADLIPNLVSIVASAAKVETNFVKSVTDARSKWGDAKTELEKDKAGVEMANGIAALVNAVAVSENYPVLQANKQYVALTDEVSGTQNRITVARGRYIEVIRKYNTAVKMFPGNILAGMFGFSTKEYYEAEEGSLKTPVLGEGKLPTE